MDVLHTHPHFWPHVQRGAEREIHDLAQRLGARGHGQRLLTTTPEGLVQRRRHGHLAVTHVRVPRRLPGRLHHETAFAAVAAVGALTSRADLVHSWLYGDGYGVGQAGRLRRRPWVLKLTGTVVPERMARLPLDDRMLRSALDRADEVWCNSPYAHGAMAGFGREMHVVPAGVDTDAFSPGGARADRPTVLLTSASDDPRKRVEDVIAAWPAVRAALPGARLRIAGHASPERRARLLEPLAPPDRADVTFLGLAPTEALVAEYRSAWVTVVPSVHEALGLVTLESLACGTPVAGARSGATPDLVGEEAWLFTPLDAEDAARAIVAAAGAAHDPAVAARSRARAEPYGWDVVADVVEARYRRLVGA